MNPTPAIPIALILIGLLVVLIVALSAKTIRQGVITGLILALVCGLTFPGLILAIAFDDWDTDFWTIPPMIFLALITTGLALPLGALAGAVTAKCSTLVRKPGREPLLARRRVRRVLYGCILVILLGVSCYELQLHDMSCRKDEIDIGGGEVLSMAAVPNSNLLLVGTNQNKAQLWDLQTKSRERDCRADLLAQVAAHPNEDWFALNESVDRLKQRVARLSVTRPKAVFYYPDSLESVYSIAFSSSGKLLAAGHLYGVTIWDTESGQLITKLAGHTSAVGTIAFYEDRLIAYGGQSNKYIHVWDVTDNIQLALLDAQSDWINAIFFLNETTILALGMTRPEKHSHSSGTLRLFDLSSGTCVKSAVTGQGINAGWLAPDKSWFVAGCLDGRLMIGEIPDLNITKRIQAHKARVGAFAYFPARELLASASDAANNKDPIRLWDVNCLHKK